MADLITSVLPDAQIYASKRWHLSDLSNVGHLLDKIIFIDCDLTDPVSTSDLIQLSKPDIVFHFAAESFVSPSWKNPSRYMDLNYRGTLNLLEAIRLHSPHTFIHIPGSGEEYGDISTEDLPITESTNINPVNPYAVTKVAQDLISKVYFDSYGLNVIRTRSFNHEGPRRKNVFGLPWYAYQISRIKKGLQPPVLKTGHTADKRNFTHVVDMCNAYLLAVQHCKPGDLYLVGNSDPSYECTFKWALDEMIRLSGCSDIRVEQDTQYVRPTNVPYLISSSKKFVTQTGWQPKKSLTDILADTLEYWSEHPLLFTPIQCAGTIRPL